MSLAYEQADPDDDDDDGSRQAAPDIGSIILEAQRFADHTADQARRTADALIRHAQVEAERIVERARVQAAEEAGRITEEAARQAAEEAARIEAEPVGPPVPPEAITQLVSTIDGFARTNRALVEELTLLRQSLAPTAAPTTPPAARPPQSTLHAVPAGSQPSAPPQPGPAPAHQAAPTRA